MAKVQINMAVRVVNKSYLWITALLTAFIALLYLSRIYDYLLFHSIAELFSIVIASGVFMIAWNSREFSENDYLLFIGIASIFVAGVDFLHTLAYAGMNIFRGYDKDLYFELH